MKDKFIKAYTENITRPGADKLLAWIESSDFFTAPASTRFHLSSPGGLLEHSLHVFERMKAICANEATITPGFNEPSMGDDCDLRPASRHLQGELLRGRDA